MSSLCKTCGEYMLDPERHQCPPIYRVCVVDHDDEDEPPDEWTTVRARSYEDAAEKRAEEYDQDDHTLLRGGEMIALVFGPDKTTKRFRVTGEAVATYTAREETQP